MTATVGAAELMTAVANGLESSVVKLEGLQDVVADLVRRADALGDERVVETVQSIDHLLQGLERLARTAGEMKVVAANEPMPAFPASTLERLDLFTHSEGDGDCDLF
jgi:hypothetical protein